MVVHTCPVCRLTHEVREARAQVAYGRQFTSSPECESERRRRRRIRATLPIVSGPTRVPSAWQRLRSHAAKSLHAWVVAATGADLVRTAAWMRGGDLFR
jgi:hypothetical protein